ncbi:MAG: peptidoglycan-binding protein LysM [Lutibacter sp.]|nr:peptidoglycan-binding protein LysM [Lutibacter sp.]MDP3359395.1 peptidoglycan-binding protein LysM [Lutibacter sp.]
MKKTIFFTILLTIGVFISSFTKDKKVVSSTNNSTTEIALVPTEKEVSPIIKSNIPFVGKSFNGFKEALAFRESGGRYDIVSSFGYLGKYQFGESTLKRFNIHDKEHFLENTELQEDAFMALCSLNKWILRKEIEKKVGKKINGIEITESGILAAAHLAGTGNIKEYLRTNGKHKFTDAFGSSMQHYLKKFGGYDTSIIEADKNPKVM